MRQSASFCTAPRQQRFYPVVCTRIKVRHAPAASGLSWPYIELHDSHPSRYPNRKEIRPAECSRTSCTHSALRISPSRSTVVDFFYRLRNRMREKRHTKQL